MKTAKPMTYKTSMTTSPFPHPLQLVNKKELTRVLGRCYSSLRRDILRGEFPAPIKIGPRDIAWRYAEIEQWIESRQIANLPGPEGRHG